MNMQQRIARPELRAQRSPQGRAARLAGWLRRHRLAAGAVLIAALAAVGYNLYAGGTEGDAGEPVIVAAERGDVENVVTAVGSLQPLRFVDVGAQVSGQLKKIYVQPGDEVEQGQLLAEIDATVQTSRVESDRAQLQNLQSQLAERIAQQELAAIQAKRQEALMAIGGTSQEALDAARAGLKSALAQVRSTQAQIRQSESVLRGNEATLGYSKIYAPIAGTVSSLVAREGQTLNANQQAPTILQIADLSIMTVSAQVSEADVPNLRMGMDAYFTTLGSPDQRWGGKLRQILPTPQVVNNVVMYTALFDVENPGRELMTQMTAQVFFVLSAAHDAVTVPVSALRFTDRGGRGGRGGAAPGGAAGAEDAQRGGDNAEAVQASARPGGGAGGDRFARGRTRPAVVTVVLENGQQQERNVMVGVSDRIKAEVVSGLEDGEQVVAGTVREENGERENRRPGGFGGGFGPRGFGGAP